mgnify:CR=1 FL=1
MLSEIFMRTFIMSAVNNLVFVFVFVGLVTTADFVVASNDEPHDSHETILEFQASEKSPLIDEPHKKIIIALDIDETDDQASGRSIRIIRTGGSSDIDQATGEALKHEGIRVLNNERLATYLPDDIRGQIQKALEGSPDTDEALHISEFDVIVSDAESPHWVMRSDALRFHGPHREMAHRRAPPAPLSQKAAECVLKTLAKVTTESGTQLLREACAQAYP